MHDPIDRTPRPEAEARHRRMHRRVAKRRLTRVGLSAATVFTIAVMLRPELPSRSVVETGSDSLPDTTSGLMASRLQTPRPSTLAAHSIWKPAGEVLKRNKAANPVLPFAPDLRENERHESLNRWHRIYSYSARYRIKPDLARRIYDAAITAGLEPELGFRLVRVESVFDPQAESRAGALGLTQLMLGTAREFEPNVTREQLLNPDVNLRIGFKYLRSLIREHKGDLTLALLVYNRGPVAVGRALALGQNPANGYENLIIKGYRGRGTLD